MSLPALGAAPTVTRLLGDASNRALISALASLGDRATEVAELQARALPDTPVRFVRDRLRALSQASVVARPDGGSGSGWLLTPAGQDLHRIYAVATRIVARAGGGVVAATPTPTFEHEHAVNAALQALSDPAVLLIVGQLASASTPLDPDELEHACEPIARRTLYRRLRVLQDEGLVERLVTHQVPRHTHYAINDHWRPVAGVLLLASWWELRHVPEGAAALDLLTLLALVAPVAAAPRGTAGVVQCRVDDPVAAPPIAAHLADGGLQIRRAAAEVPHDAAIGGTSRAWAAALVAGDRAGLTIEGDATLADACIASVRAALLAYVR